MSKPENPNKERQPIAIIAHGFNGAHGFGKNYFETFNRLDYQCFTLDFPGSEKSRTDNNTLNMSIIDEQQALEAVVHHFQQQPDIAPERVVLVGESQGGLVAALTAANLSNRIHRLILVFPALCEHCTVIDLLGHSLSAVSIPKGESLTFDFTTETEGDTLLKTALIPTQPNDGGDLRYQISIDDGEPVAYSLKEPFRSEQWKLNVLRGQARRTTEIHLTKGTHTLEIKALDNHIILDQWMIDFNKSRKHYLFPLNS